MNRNKNVEALRGVAMLGMLFYHYSMSISGLKIGTVGSTFRELVGQFSLVSFFILSGFGTYTWCKRTEESGEKPSLKKYLSNRLFKLTVPYYLCLLILFLVTPSLSLIREGNLKQILMSLFLVHNFSISGGVNGVTWTIATIFQLYFFFPFFYRIIKKTGAFSLPVVWVMSVGIKFVLSNLAVVNEMDTMYLVLIGIRLPFTIFDLFFYGMCCAFFYAEYKDRWSKIPAWIIYSCLGICVLLFFGVMYFWSTKIGIYGTSIQACMSQSIMGILLCFLLFFLANARFSYNTVIGKVIQIISKNEYGVFLWHMIIMGNILNYGGDWYGAANEKVPTVLLIVLVLVAVLIGCGYQKVIGYIFKDMRRDNAR